MPFIWYLHFCKHYLFFAHSKIVYLNVYTHTKNGMQNLIYILMHIEKVGKIKNANLQLDQEACSGAFAFGFS